MTAKYFAILTNQGAARLANAAALGTKLNLTQMAVGDANGALPVPDATQTKLINQKRIAPLNMLSVDPNNTSQIIAEQIIPESEGGFWIREIGLYDDEGILIAVANCPETYKPQLQEGSGRTQTIRMVLIVSSTSAITLKIDPSVVLATRQYVDSKVIEVKSYADNILHAHEQSRNHPDATLTEKGFVQLGNSVSSDSEIIAATLKAVKIAMDNASARLAKDRNGADIPDKAAFLLNLGLGEAANGVSVVGSSRNARINIIAPSATATFTADEIVVETALGGKYYRLAAFNKAVNLAVNGAGGLDTGAVPSSGYVALYAIYNPTTSTSALLAVNATSTVAPEVYGGGNMPAGFTASALVSVWRVASGQFVTGIQRGRRITFSPFLVMASSISAASYTSLDISSCVPRNAQSIDGNANPNITGTGYNTNISVASLSDGTGSVSIGCGGAAVTAPFSGIQIATPQTIYYTLTASAPLQTSFISITGYEI